MQKDVSRFIVPQAVPEIYMKNERLKNRGDVFFCYRLYVGLYWLVRSHSTYASCKASARARCFEKESDELSEVQSRGNLIAVAK